MYVCLGPYIIFIAKAHEPRASRGLEDYRTFRDFESFSVVAACLRYQMPLCFCSSTYKGPCTQAV